MNKGMDVLSRRNLLLSTLESKVLGFECVKGIIPKMKISKKSMRNTLAMLTGCSIWRMGFFSRKTGYAYQDLDLEDS